MRLLKSLFVSLLFYLTYISCENKYSRFANEEKNKGSINFRALEKPFRMNKLNLLWIKAQQRLTEPKLKSLYSDLMIHDKEEITLKRLKSEGGDKEGLREADIRKKLTNIMLNYALLEHFDTEHTASKGHHKDHSPYSSMNDNVINKSLFKDKKLNQLWAKAETSGFTSEELAALKEEFIHHQDKIDQYYELLNNIDSEKKDEFKNIINEDETESFNEVSNRDENEVSKDFLDKTNLIRDKHRGLRDGYDKLNRITARGPNNKEFIEPKVQGLWKMAAAANFSVEELASLKVELHHYENRLLKLRHLQAQHVNNLDKHHSKIARAGDKMDHFEEQQQMIKKHSRKVEKMHADIENRILERHSEL